MSLTVRQEIQKFTVGTKPALTVNQSEASRGVQPKRKDQDAVANGSLTRILGSKGMPIMLVLTRKRSEMIQIGDNVVIKVIQIDRGSVQIGIDAPKHIRVLRSELFDGGSHAPMPITSTLAERIRNRRHAAAPVPVPAGAD